jgi:type 1 fimbria pilin
MTGVYATSLAGIGMRVRDAQGKPMVGTGACSTDSSLGNTGSDGAFSVSGTFELIKTGPVTAGSISGTYRTGVLNTGYELNNGANLMTIASGSTIRSISCSVNPASASQTIFLATVSPTMFASAGAVAARMPFALALNCQSGVKVSVMFSSASGKESIPSVLASVGTATGIGVQLLDASQTPISLDSSVLLTGNTTGNMSFQFYAQYYRLGASPISPGTVRAMAIFTMIYQ